MEVVIGLLVLAVVLLLVFKAVVIVPAGHVGVVQRLGKYTRQVSPGLQTVLPLVDRVRRVDARARELVLVAEPLVCSDNMIVLVNATLEFMVTDGLAACTAVDDHEGALEKQLLNRLRDAAGRAPSDTLRSTPGQLTWDVRGLLWEDVKPWGLLALRLSLTPTPETEPRTAMSRSFRLAPPV